jgi:hypothetical protein
MVYRNDATACDKRGLLNAIWKRKTKRPASLRAVCISGADETNRTPDLLITKYRSATYNNTSEKFRASNKMGMETDRVMPCVACASKSSRNPIGERLRAYRLAAHSAPAIDETGAAKRTCAQPPSASGQGGCRVRCAAYQSADRCGAVARSVDTLHSRSHGRPACTVVCAAAVRAVRQWAVRHRARA